MAMVCLEFSSLVNQTLYKQPCEKQSGKLPILFSSWVLILQVIRPYAEIAGLAHKTKKLEVSSIYKTKITHLYSRVQNKVYVVFCNYNLITDRSTVCNLPLALSL